VRGGDLEMHRDSEKETRRRRLCEEETRRHTETPRRRRARRRLGRLRGGDSETQVL